MIMSTHDIIHFILQSRERHHPNQTSATVKFSKIMGGGGVDKHLFYSIYEADILYKHALAAFLNPNIFFMMKRVFFKQFLPSSIVN